METHVLLAFQPPWWLQEPTWLHELARQVRVFIFQHQTFGLYLVIFLEEIGIPLPAPGDIAITYGGYLATRGTIPYPPGDVDAGAGGGMRRARDVDLRWRRR